MCVGGCVCVGVSGGGGGWVCVGGGGVWRVGVGVCV